MKRSKICGVFVCAVALFAAALGDVVVEGISNAQILWRGNYTDRSSLDLLPMFVLGVAALIATQGLAVLAQANETGQSARALILSTSRALMPRDIARLLPAIFALQILVLFSMETTEQVVVYGRAFGGALWLGGPIVISLTIHALFSVSAAFGVSIALSAVGETITRIVKCIFARFVACARLTTVTSRERIVFALALIVAESLVERGPPVLIAPR